MKRIQKQNSFAKKSDKIEMKSNNAIKSNNSSPLAYLKNKFDTPIHQMDPTQANIVEKFSKALQKGMNTISQSFHPPSLASRLMVQQSANVLPSELDNQVSDAEKQADREFAISTVSLGLAVLGATVLHSTLLTLLSVPWVIYASVSIFREAYAMLKKGKVTVDTLSSCVILTCVFGRYYVILNVACTSYYLSRKLVQKVKSESRRSVIDVFRQQPQTVWLLVEGVEVEVPFEQLTVGDIVVVHAGGFIPADGTIVAGTASIDQHILTGESQPAEKGVGDQVFASTVVLSGQIQINVEQAGEETTVAKIGQILNDTSDFKASTQLRAEELTDKTVLPTLILGGLSLPFIGPGGAAAIFNAHYKYRFNIVAPISILTYLNLMAKQQILIKDGKTLDLLNQIDTIVFDKTGTLTEEQPHVNQIHTYAEYSEAEILTYAAAAEHKQSHPIAKAILEAAALHQLSLPKIDEAAYRIGYGLSVVIDNQLIRVGSLRFLEAEGILLPSAVMTTWEACHAQGHSLVMVALGDQLIGAIELQPTIRAEAKEIIQQLRAHTNVESIYIISGDNEEPTRKLAQELGIDNYFAETLPENKATLIEQLQSEGKFVCFVGDGINDAIALKKSQVSISLRGASTVATDTAQIILMDGSLNRLTTLFDLATEFENNLNVGFRTLLAPTVIGMAGALFWHFGVGATIVLSHSGLLLGIVNSTLPLIKRRHTKTG